MYPLEAVPAESEKSAPSSRLDTPLSLTEYAAQLSHSGIQTLPGAPDSFWAAYEKGTVIRVPTFQLSRPDTSEVYRALRRFRALAANYLIEPSAECPANAWLYICTDRAYGLHTLPATMRRNTRRGLKQLRIAPLSVEQLLVHGEPAFCDTRRRAGLSDGTPAEFARHFRRRTQCTGHTFLGAWKGDALAAFLSIIEVADWVEIHGCYSRDDYLSDRPNDTLMYSALSHYLVDEGRRLVSYGLSSIQTESKEAGLHAFKTKVGFTAKPVHRAFIPHPVLSPFMNRVTLLGLNIVLRLAPGNRLLRKAHGVLSSLLGHRPAWVTP